LIHKYFNHNVGLTITVQKYYALILLQLTHWLLHIVSYTIILVNNKRMELRLVRQDSVNAYNQMWWKVCTIWRTFELIVTTI